MKESVWASDEVREAVLSAVGTSAWSAQHADIEDLAQEALLRLLERAPPSVRSPKRYARRVAQFTVTDAFRRRSAKCRDERKTRQLPPGHEICGSFPSPVSRLLAQEEVDGTLALWRQVLTPKRMQAMFLRFVLGLSSSEAGRVMDASPNAIDSLVYKARKSLESVGEWPGEGGEL